MSNFLIKIYQKLYREFLKKTGAKILILENEIHFTKKNTFQSFALKNKKFFWRAA